MSLSVLFKRPGNLAKIDSVGQDQQEYFSAENDVTLFSVRTSAREDLYDTWLIEVKTALQNSPMQLNWFHYTPLHNDDDIAISSGLIPGMRADNVKRSADKLKAITGLPYFAVETHGDSGLITMNMPVYHKSLLIGALTEKRDALSGLFQKMRAISDIQPPIQKQKPDEMTSGV